MYSVSVFDKIHDIQNEYLELLHSINNNLNKSNLVYYLDEIINFWKKRDTKIKMIIDWLDNDGLNISYFTCATKLDLDSYDHYSFVLYGEYHIFDDPIVTHLTVSSTLNDRFSEMMYVKTKELIEDNIKVLKYHETIIWILPIRFLYSNIHEITGLENKVDEYFLSLFKDIDSVEKYFEKCELDEDIDKNLIDRFKNTICLTNYETPDNTFLEKFQMLKEGEELKTMDLKNDAQIFYFQMKSYILQALDVIFTSTAARMVPFIRYRPSFINYQLLNQAFSTNIEDISLIGAKSVVHYLLFQRFYHEKICELTFVDFVRKYKLSNIDEKLEDSKLAISGQPNFKYISKFVDSYLEKIYTLIDSDLISNKSMKINKKKQLKDSKAFLESNRAKKKNNRKRRKRKYRKKYGSPHGLHKYKKSK